MDRMPMQALSSAPLGAAGLSTLHSLQYNAKNPADRNRNLAKVCGEVEGVFINQLMKQMRQTMVNSVNPKKKRTEYYQLCEQQVAQAMAAGGGIGLARRLFQDMQHRITPRDKENQDELSSKSVPSGDPAPAGDLPVPGALGMSGTGSSSPGGDPGGDYPGPGNF